jgi:membrane protease YdiL (CAAX protease family)
MQEPLPEYSPAPAATTRLWGVRDIAIVTAIVLLLFVFVPGFIYLPAEAIWGENSEEADVASAIANLVWYVTVIFTVLGYIRRKGGKPADLGLRWPTGAGRDSWGRIVGIAVLTFIAMYAVTAAYSLIALELLDLDFLEPSEQIPDDFFDHKVALAVLGVAVVIGAPFTEELFFRGFLYGGVRTYIAVPLAALLTGVLFSLLHANVGLIIPFTLIGAILALSYQRSGNLATSIGAHFFFNFISFMVLAFVPEARN